MKITLLSDARLTALLFTLAIVLAACSNAPRLPELGPDAVILAYGDSLTFGTGAGEGESYPSRLAALTGRRVINAGVPGETSDRGLQRLPGLLDAHRPDLLILCHGGNDMLRQLDRARTVANLRGMIDAARQRNIPVVLLAVPQLGLLLDPAPFYAEIAAEAGIPLEEEAITDVLADRRLKSDRIHPNAAGYRVIAESVAGLLKKSGALR